MLGIARRLLLLLELTEVLLPVGEALLATGELRQLALDLLLLREHALLDLHDPAAVLRDLCVDLRAQVDGVLPGADLGLAPE
jgi:hypothetical protein